MNVICRGILLYYTLHKIVAIYFPLQATIKQQRRSSEKNTCFISYLSDGTQLTNEQM